MHENFAKTNTQKAPVLKVVTGLFVFVVAAFTFVSYWKYYTHDQLAQYIPSNVSFVVQVKEALVFQKTFSLKDGNLKNAYAFIDKHVGWNKSFFDDVVPLIDTQFAFAVFDNHATSSVIVLQTKDMDATKKIFADYEYETQNENIVRIFLNTNDLEIPKTSFSFPKKEYAPIKAFAKKSFLQGVETMNTNLVQSDLYIKFRNNRGVWSYLVRPNIPEGIASQHAKQPILDLENVPSEFSVFARGVSTHIFENYTFGAPNIILQAFSQRLSETLGSYFDYVSYDNVFLAGAAVQKGQGPDEIQDVLTELFAILHPKKIPNRLRDGSVAQEIVIREKKDFRFESLAGFKAIILDDEVGLSLYYLEDNDFVYISNSQSLLAQYLNGSAHMVFDLPLQSCWQTNEPQYFLVQHLGSYLGFKPTAQGVYGCIF